MTKAGTRVSPIRRALLWWFAWPGNPYVTVNFSVDFSHARAYLAALGEPRVSVNALVAAGIARTLRTFPQGNSRIIGRTIVAPKHIGIAMPVNLLGHAGERSRELGVALVERAEELSLRELAAASTAHVRAERGGEPQNVVIRQLLGLADAAPPFLFDATLSLLNRVNHSPRLADELYRRFPITTALSNAGAAIGLAPGMLFRGADVAIPQRLVHIGTFWGASAVQDEVIALDGVPTIRPMLPILFLFDHRLIDGVMGARMATHLGAILQDPAREFGAVGERA